MDDFTAMPVESAKAAPAIRLLVCVGPRCDAEGRGRALLARLQEALTTAFPSPEQAARISCSTRDCLRHCTQDPVMRVEPSGDVFAGPAIDDLLRLVRAALAVRR